MPPTGSPAGHFSQLSVGTEPGYSQHWSPSPSIGSAPNSPWDDMTVFSGSSSVQNDSFAMSDIQMGDQTWPLEPLQSRTSYDDPFYLAFYAN